MKIITIISILLFSLLINIPLGRWRIHYKRFSFPWLLLIHASVPIIIGLRLWFEVDIIFIPLFILFAVMGQVIGRITVKVRS